MSDEEVRQLSSTETLRRIKGKYDTAGNNINVWYVDGKCHHDMLHLFGIENKPENLPAVIAIWHHKQKYSVMKSDFTFDNMDFFMKKALRNAVSTKNYVPGFKMHNRNCA